MIFIYGDIIVDILVQSDGGLRYGSDITGSIAMRGGGSAANTATWLAHLGTDVYFTGMVGEDAAGEFLDHDMEERGLRRSLIRTEATTGAILVFVDSSGERTMVTDRGANLVFIPEDLPVAELRRNRHLHITGYSLFGAENLVETARAAMAAAETAGLTVSLDPSSWALLRDFGAPHFLDLTGGCDIVFPNREEALILAGYGDVVDRDSGRIGTGTATGLASGYGTTSRTGSTSGAVAADHPSWEEIAHTLSAYYGIVVIKLGTDGCVVADKTGIRLLPLPPGEKEPVVDSTGAGDAFAAGFLSSWIDGASREETSFGDTLPSDASRGRVERAAQRGMETALLCMGIRGGRPPLAKE